MQRDSVLRQQVPCREVHRQGTSGAGTGAGGGGQKRLMDRAAGVSFHVHTRTQTKGVPSRGNSVHKGLVTGNQGFLPTGEDVCPGGGLAGEAEAKE